MIQTNILNMCSMRKIRTKQDLSYISICSLSSLYNSKFILMAQSLGTNVVVTRVHCTSLLTLFKTYRDEAPTAMS